VVQGIAAQAEPESNSEKQDGRPHPIPTESESAF